jgi:hypothetical protein
MCSNQLPDIGFGYFAGLLRQRLQQWNVGRTEIKKRLRWYFHSLC